MKPEDIKETWMHITRWKKLIWKGYMKELMQSFRASKYMRQMMIELQGETDESTLLIGYVSPSLSVIDKSSRQKVSKDVTALSGTISQQELIDSKLLLPTKAEYT